MNRRILLLAVPAAILAMTPDRADAGFDISSTRTTSTADATKDVVKFFALNTGNGTGTRLQTGKVTVTSIAAPLVFEAKDIDGDGADDINIFGEGIPYTSTGPAGTFTRFGNTFTSSLSIASRSPENRSDPDGGGTPTNNPVATYANLFTFTGEYTIPGAGPIASTTAQAFAMAVIPKGVEVRISARLFGDLGGGVDVAASNAVPEPATAGLLATVGLGLLARRR